MPVYQYKGRSAQGQLVEGEMEAYSVESLINQLTRQSLVVIAVDEKLPGLPMQQSFQSLFEKKSVSATDKIMFCRQMYTITKSGIPIIRGLRGLSSSMSNYYFREILFDIADRLESGLSLSVAMSKYNSIFDHLFISMISVGEQSGNLELVFDQLADYLERDEKTRRRLKSATLYPMFVLVAIGLALIVVNLFVIPKFAEMFNQFEASLPFLTKILISLSNFFLSYWWLIVLFGYGVYFSLKRYLKTREGASLWDEKKLKIPILGRLIYRGLMARYTRSFGLMLKAGVPMNQALALSGRTVSNQYIAQKIQAVRDGVERGESLLKTHVEAKLFSPLILQMVAVGEESGQISTLLIDVAEFFERELDYELKVLSAKIEPLLVIVMACFVSVLALGIFLPIWDMYTIQDLGS